MAKSNHRWKFARVGGIDQVLLRSGADIINLDQLDQKLWVALACPVRGLELDQKTLELIDTDKDGRIRVPEVLAAVRWAREVLKDPGDLLKGGDSVPLAAINDVTPADAALLSGARATLKNLGRGDDSAISLSDLASTEKIFAATRFNGDGVVPADAADDAAVCKAIEDVIAAQGAVTDRSGKPGVNQANVDAFFTAAAALSDWHAQGEAEGDAGKALLPLAANTAAAAAAVAAVQVKVDDYFARCRLAAFDARAALALNRDEAAFTALADKDLTQGNEQVARLPLCRIEPGRPLPLMATDGLNPAWSGAIAELSRAAVAPLLGANKTNLSEADWGALQARVAPYRAWQAAKPASTVDKLELPRLRELLSSGAREAITALIQKDAALAEENAQLAELEKLVRFQRDLVKLLNNFVNFSEFYSLSGAVFQAGALYLDGRRCDLTIRVEDASKHAALAGLSRAYLAYCDCTRPDGQKLAIVAAFTGGDTDFLMVGRNGVFYDRKGQDWDATITKVIENPLSIRQAFFAPYKSFVRLFEEQLTKRAAAADAAANERVKGAATSAATADQTRPAAKAEPKKIDIGTVAAIGVAVGGVATFLSSILATFFGLGMWMPLGLLALLLAISGPAMLLAWLKLRQRNLGPILDANGWAINGRVRINVPFGTALTSLATLPAGAERTLRDPFYEKSSPWGLYLALLIILGVGVGWLTGRMDHFLPISAKSTTVLGNKAPTLP